MRVSLAILTASTALGALLSSCSTPAQPLYADLSYQVRCTHLDGTRIAGCMSPGRRDIYGFNGDMGARFSCTTAEHDGQRTVSFSVTATDSEGNDLGVTLQNATVPAEGGAPIGNCQFTFTDDNQYGGTCSAGAPTEDVPCQVSNIQFTTDTETGLPLTNVSVYCLDAESIPATSPDPTYRSVSSPDDESAPMQIHFYSCAVIQS